MKTNQIVLPDHQAMILKRSAKTCGIPAKELLGMLIAMVGEGEDLQPFVGTYLYKSASAAADAGARVFGDIPFVIKTENGGFTVDTAEPRR